MEKLCCEKLRGFAEAGVSIERLALTSKQPLTQGPLGLNGYLSLWALATAATTATRATTEKRMMVESVGVQRKRWEYSVWESRGERRRGESAV